MNRIATLALTAALAFGVAAPADAIRPMPGATHQKVWQPCLYEDSINCIWDAKHRGNGKGKSFKATKKGKIKYISHRKAHRLLNRHLR